MVLQLSSARLAVDNSDMSDSTLYGALMLSLVLLSVYLHTAVQVVVGDTFNSATPLVKCKVILITRVTRPLCKRLGGCWLETSGIY
jgi:hypothetical protein